MSEARHIAFTALDTFKGDLAERFICLCHGNDGSKLTLLKIYDTIDEIYDKHIEKRLDVGTVDIAPVPKWISVKERLPEPGERVLATDGYFVGEFYINGRGQWQRYNVNNYLLLAAFDILHWMPLAEPPKEDA